MTKRRGALIGVILACAALAACLVAVLWRGDARAASAARATNNALADTKPTAKTVTDGITVTDLTVPGPAALAEHDAASGEINRVGSVEIAVRRYDPAPDGPGQAAEPWATLVWAHGGSFVRGGLDMPEADWAARQFAAAGMRVYSVDYVLASDTVKAPAPANDVAAVAHWVAQTDDAPLVIGGASAGAHLATFAALDVAEAARASDTRAAHALLLEYPTLHRVQRADAEVAKATAGLPARQRFDPDRIAEMYATHLGEDAGAGGDTSVLVVGEIGPERLALLPPTVIVNAEFDDLRASGEQFAEQLAVAGVRVTEYTQAGTVHGYLNRPAESPETAASARQTIDRFVAGAREAVGE